MKEERERKNSEQMTEIESAETASGVAAVETERIPLDVRVETTLDNQNNELGRRETGHAKKTLSGFRKFVATTMLMGSSLLAIGCGAEKPHVEKPNADSPQVSHKAHDFLQRIKKEHQDKKSDAKKMASEIKSGTRLKLANEEDVSGDINTGENEKPLKSEKNNSPEAEQFLNNN